VFAAYLNQVLPPEVAELRLGKNTEAQLAEAHKLHRHVSEYAYGAAVRQDRTLARPAGSVSSRSTRPAPPVS
jgi:hypothetical protein